MVVLFLSSSFRRQACQSVRVCHGCGDPFSGLSGLNFELHLFAKFPEFLRTNSCVRLQPPKSKQNKKRRRVNTTLITYYDILLPYRSFE
jgi:hypothetical protein